MALRYDITNHSVSGGANSGVDMYECPKSNTKPWDRNIDEVEQQVVSLSSMNNEIKQLFSQYEILYNMDSLPDEIIQSQLVDIWGVKSFGTINNTLRKILIRLANDNLTRLMKQYMSEHEKDANNYVSRENFNMMLTDSYSRKLSASKNVPFVQYTFVNSEFINKRTGMFLNEGDLLEISAEEDGYKKVFTWLDSFVDFILRVKRDDDILRSCKIIFDTIPCKYNGYTIDEWDKTSAQKKFTVSEDSVNQYIASLNNTLKKINDYYTLEYKVVLGSFDLDGSADPKVRTGVRPSAKAKSTTSAKVSAKSKPIPVQEPVAESKSEPIVKQVVEPITEPRRAYKYGHPFKVIHAENINEFSKYTYLKRVNFVSKSLGVSPYINEFNSIMFGLLLNYRCNRLRIEELTAEKQCSAFFGDIRAKLQDANNQLLELTQFKAQADLGDKYLLMLENANAQIAEMVQASELIGVKLAELKQIVIQRENEIADIQKNTSTLEQSNKSYIVKNNALEAQVLDNLRVIKEKQAEVLALNRKIGEYGDEMNRLDEVISTMKSERAELDGKLALAQQEIDKFKNAFNQVSRTNDELRKEKKPLTDQIETQKQKISELMRQAEELTRVKNKLDSTIMGYEDTVQKLLNNIDLNEKSITELKTKISELTSDLQSGKDAIVSKSGEVDKLKHDIDDIIGRMSTKANVIRNRYNLELANLNGLKEKLKSMELSSDYTERAELIRDIVYSSSLLTAYSAVLNDLEPGYFTHDDLGIEYHVYEDDIKRYALDMKIVYNDYKDVLEHFRRNQVKDKEIDTLTKLNQILKDKNNELLLQKSELESKLYYNDQISELRKANPGDVNLNLLLDNIDSLNKENTEYRSEIARITLLKEEAIATLDDKRKLLEDIRFDISELRKDFAMYVRAFKANVSKTVNTRLNAVVREIDQMLNIGGYEDFTKTLGLSSAFVKDAIKNRMAFLMAKITDLREELTKYQAKQVNQDADIERLTKELAVKTSEIIKQNQIIDELKSLAQSGKQTLTKVVRQVSNSELTTIAEQRHKINDQIAYNIDNIDKYTKDIKQRIATLHTLASPRLHNYTELAYVLSSMEKAIAANLPVSDKLSALDKFTTGETMRDAYAIHLLASMIANINVFDPKSTKKVEWSEFGTGIISEFDRALESKDIAQAVEALRSNTSGVPKSNQGVGSNADVIGVMGGMLSNVEQNTTTEVTPKIFKYVDANGAITKAGTDAIYVLAMLPTMREYTERLYIRFGLQVPSLDKQKIDYIGKVIVLTYAEPRVYEYLYNDDRTTEYTKYSNIISMVKLMDDGAFDINNIIGTLYSFGLSGSTSLKKSDDMGSTVDTIKVIASSIDNMRSKLSKLESESQTYDQKMNKLRYDIEDLKQELTDATTKNQQYSDDLSKVYKAFDQFVITGRRIADKVVKHVLDDGLYLGDAGKHKYKEFSTSTKTELTGYVGEFSDMYESLIYGIKTKLAEYAKVNKSAEAALKELNLLRFTVVRTRNALRDADIGSIQNTIKELHKSALSTLRDKDRLSKSISSLTERHAKASTELSKMLAAVSQIDVSNVVPMVRSLNDKLKSAEAKVDNLTSQLDNMINTNANTSEVKDTELAQLRTRIVELETDIDALTKEKTSMTDEMVNQQRLAADLQQRLDSEKKFKNDLLKDVESNIRPLYDQCQLNIARLESELKAAKEIIYDYQKQISAVGVDLSICTKVYSELRESHDTLVAKYNVEHMRYETEMAGLSSHLRQLESERDAIASELSQEKTRVAELLQSYQNVQRELSTVSNSSTTLTEKVDTLSKQLDVTNTELKRVALEKATTSSSLDKLLIEKAALESEIVKLTTDQMTTNVELDKLRSDNESLLSKLRTSTTVGDDLKRLTEQVSQMTIEKAELGSTIEKLTKDVESKANEIARLVSEIDGLRNTMELKSDIDRCVDIVNEYIGADVKLLAAANADKQVIIDRLTSANDKLKEQLATSSLTVEEFITKSKDLEKAVADRFTRDNELLRKGESIAKIIKDLDERVSTMGESLSESASRIRNGRFAIYDQDAIDRIIQTRDKELAAKQALLGKDQGIINAITSLIDSESEESSQKSLQDLSSTVNSNEVSPEMRAYVSFILKSLSIQGRMKEITIPGVNQHFDMLRTTISNKLDLFKKMSTTIADLRSQLSSKNTERIVELETKLAQMEAALSSERENARMISEELTSRITSLMKDKKSLEGETTKITDELTKCSTLFASLKSERDKVISDIALVGDDLSTLTKRVGDVRISVDTLREYKDSLMRGILEAQTIVEGATKGVDLSTVNKEVNETMKSMVDELVTKEDTGVDTSALKQKITDSEKLGELRRLYVMMHYSAKLQDIIRKKEDVLQAMLDSKHVALGRIADDSKLLTSKLNELDSTKSARDALQSEFDAHKRERADERIRFMSLVDKYKSDAKRLEEIVNIEVDLLRKVIVQCRTGTKSNISKLAKRLSEYQVVYESLRDIRGKLREDIGLVTRRATELTASVATARQSSGELAAKYNRLHSITTYLKDKTDHTQELALLRASFTLLRKQDANLIGQLRKTIGDLQKERQILMAKLDAVQTDTASSTELKAGISDMTNNITNLQERLTVELAASNKLGQELDRLRNVVVDKHGAFVKRIDDATELINIMKETLAIKRGICNEADRQRYLTSIYNLPPCREQAAEVIVEPVVIKVVDKGIAQKVRVEAPTPWDNYIKTIQPPSKSKPSMTKKKVQVQTPWDDFVRRSTPL